MPQALHNCLYAFTQGLNTLGVKKVVVSPGSRNAALMQALNEEGFELFSVVDERSAGFVGLGMSQASDEPVALLCTSGTALLNYYPAVAEAFYSNTPLVVISADRPEAMIDNWTGQCIRQRDVFANHIREFVQMPEDLTDAEAFFTQSNALVNFVFGPDRGPVHINFPIAEPFYFSPWDPDRRTYSGVSFEVKEELINGDDEAWFRNVLCSTRILAVAGYGAPEELQVAEHHVFLKDVLVPGERDEFAGWDAFLSTASYKNSVEELQPEVLITFGKYAVSKALREFLKSNKIKYHYHFNPSSELGNPFGTTIEHIAIDPLTILHILTREGAVSEFAKNWKKHIRAHSSRLDELIHKGEFNEFQAVDTILKNTKGKVHLGNSMPVRYVSFLDRHDAKIYFGNRGASGIDGCLSTAIGHAVADKESQTILIGDLSFFYDANGLWNDLDHKLRIVILNNRGGGIFDYISGPEALGDARKYQSTRHNRSAELIAQDHGLEYFPVDDLRTLEQVMKREVSSTEIVEVFTDVEVNAAFYEEFKAL